MYRLALLLPALALACASNNECVTNLGCPQGQLCVDNACVGTEVEGDAEALYRAEFRLRLDTECGICHFAGALDKAVIAGDGSWRLHSGVDLSAAQIDANWADVLDFVKPGDAFNSLLLTYARGEARIDEDRDGVVEPHPVIYQTVENLSYARVLSWLGRFPLPDVPEDAEPGEAGYVATIHDVLVRGCSCHTDPARAWSIAGVDADPAARADSFAATAAWISPADVENSPLLAYTRGEFGHSAGAIWRPGDAEYDLLVRWIGKTRP